VAGIARASEGRLRFLLAQEWQIGLGRGQAEARGGVTVTGRTPSIDVAAAGARTEAGAAGGAWCSRRFIWKKLWCCETVSQATTFSSISYMEEVMNSYITMYKEITNSNCYMVKNRT
jgi:hypothetical protein